MSPTRNRHHASSGRRSDPALGDLDQLQDTGSDTRPPGARRAEARRHAGAPRRRWPWLVLAVLLVIAAVAWSQRDTLRDWMPQTQLNRLLDNADRALAAGHLEGHQGDSARELYAAARALRGDNTRAKEGLRKVGEAELAQARDQLKAGDVAQARQSLATARALLGGGDELDRLDKELARRKASGDKLEGLLQRAGQALADGHLTGKGSAAALYRQALTADPGNAIARHGMDKIGNALSSQVRQQIDQGDLDAAGTRLDALSGLLPDYSSLPDLRARLAQARSQAHAQRQAWLNQAADALQAGRLTGSGADNALALYRKVLEADPDNDQARKGVQMVASGLLARAGQRMDDDRLDQAGQLLDEVAALAGNTASLQSAQARLQKLRDKPAPPPALSDAQKARVQSLITRAQAAAESGDLMLPPGDSAYDLYRSALAIDAGNSDAMAGLASLPGQARSLFNKALARHDTGRAAKLLSDFAQLAPGSSALPGMRARLQAARQ